MSSLELKVPPLVLLAASSAVMFALSLVAPALDFSLVQSTVIASMLVAAGVCVALAGVIEFRKSGTTVNPTTPEKASTVVSAGIYRFSRNPMYLGFALTLAGWATYLSNAASLLVLPTYIAYMNKFQIEPEERMLLTKFGTQFNEYIASVRRWL